MFLADGAKAGSEFPGLVRHIVGLLQREGAAIERIEKWSERKLAYKIHGVERGIYVLVYFRADTSRIQELRRSINLSEEIVRVLILAAEAMSPSTGDVYNANGDLIEAAKPAPPPAPAAPEAKPAEPAAPVQAADKVAAETEAEKK
jgi:small subunit ribosomal protein S6